MIIEMNFSVREYRPSEFVAPYVECYWSGLFNIQNQEDASFSMVPHGFMELIVHLEEHYCQLPGDDGYGETPDYMIIGLSIQATDVRFKSAVPVFAIRFKPEAAHLLFRTSAAEVFNKFEDSDLVMPRSFRDCCDRIREAGNTEERIRLAEEFILSVTDPANHRDDYVVRALNLIRNSELTSIDEISDKLYISRRQLERKFNEVVGVRPKQYMRLARINRVMRSLSTNNDITLTSVAYHCGYYDQSHFIRDFKKITGINPRTFFKHSDNYVTVK